jgi:hypothetical protein
MVMERRVSAPLAASKSKTSIGAEPKPPTNTTGEPVTLGAPALALLPLDPA